MRGFVKKFAIFVYFFLALFVQLLQPNSVLACENLAQNTFQQYISTSKTTLVNVKKEETYNLNRNRFEITNPTNKNNNFGFNGFNKLNSDFIIPTNLTVNNTANSIRISYNTSLDLKNAIYTRAP